MAFTPAYVPQTELDAVNQMLMSIGLSPLNTLTVQGIKDVDLARLTLHNTLRDVLEKGYDFNTDEDYPLAPDANGKIAVPANALAVDPTNQADRYTQRRDPSGNQMRLYDRTNRTFVITKVVECDITWMFPYEDIPQCARAYVSRRAGRIFQVGRVPSRIIFEFTEQMELEACAALDRAEGRSKDTNFFNHDTISARIFHRHR